MCVPLEKKKKILLAHICDVFLRYKQIGVEWQVWMAIIAVKGRASCWRSSDARLEEKTAADPKVG